jgi:AraC-like DNA-binding protein
MTRRSPAEDFASAAMVRVLVQGMTELGYTVPTDAVGHAANPAHRIGLDVKRALIESAIRQGGLASLPLLGRGVRAFEHDPTHRALASARDGLDLLERWRRLEHYVHSVHRIALEQAIEGRATLRHVSLRPGALPSAPEDLVVLGVLVALLEKLGFVDVEATIDGASVYPRADDAALRRLAQAGRTNEWVLRWLPARNRHEAGDTGARRADSSAATVRDIAPRVVPTDLCAALAWPAAARVCAAALLADPMRPRALGDAATLTGMSKRTLQRTFTTAGLTWTALIAETRVRAASWWLVESEQPIAEVGFLVGYSDQPHFTRDFGRRVGLAPGRYREHFCRARSAVAQRP